MKAFNVRGVVAWLVPLMVLATCGLLPAEPLNSVVRITRTSQAGTTIGSGSVIGQAGGSYLILTNAHVAGSRVGERVSVEFFLWGYRSQRLPGTVQWASYSGGVPPQYEPRDAAIVAVERSALGTATPDISDLFGRAAPGRQVTITSAGCPRGDWPNQFLGHPKRVTGDGLIEFVPEAVPGRSGSPLYADDGRTILGIITWADPQAGIGIAQSAANIRALLQGRRPRAVEGGEGTKAQTAIEPRSYVELAQYATLPVQIPPTHRTVAADGTPLPPPEDRQPPTALSPFAGYAEMASGAPPAASETADETQCGPGNPWCRPQRPQPPQPEPPADDEGPDPYSDGGWFRQPRQGLLDQLNPLSWADDLLTMLAKVVLLGVVLWFFWPKIRALREKLLGATSNTEPPKP